MAKRRRDDEHETAYFDRFAHCGRPIPPDCAPRDNREAYEAAFAALLRLGRWSEAFALVDDQPGLACHDPDMVAAVVSYHVHVGQCQRARDVLNVAKADSLRLVKLAEQRAAAIAATGWCPPELVALAEVLPVRVANKLEEAGVLTVEALVARTVDDLRSIEGFGVGHLRDVVAGLDRARVRHNFGDVFHK